MDRIEINGLRAFGRHGVLPRERDRGQTFVIDLALELDLAPAARSDALTDTVDYGLLAAEVAEAVTATRFDLIETLAGHLAGLALANARVATVTVRVAKPEAPVGVPLDQVAVVVRRERRAAT